MKTAGPAGRNVGRRKLPVGKSAKKKALKRGPDFLSAAALLSGSRFFHGARTDAAGAYPGGLGISAFGSYADFLEIRQPAPTGLIMGVADIVSGYRSFPTDRAYLSHDELLYGTALFPRAVGLYESFKFQALSLDDVAAVPSTGPAQKSKFIPLPREIGKYFMPDRKQFLAVEVQGLNC